MNPPKSSLMGSPPARSITRFIFTADTVINWIIATGSMLRPSLVERVLFIRSTLPPGWIILLGAGFLLFAIWQSVIIARGEIINSKVMAFAALMAVLPAIILGGSLLFSRLPWHPRSRTVLWIGEVYMLSLGAWYAGVYQALRAPTPER